VSFHAKQYKGQHLIMQGKNWVYAATPQPGADQNGTYLSMIPGQDIEFVIPAQAGIQGTKLLRQQLDPGLRRDDGVFYLSKCHSGQTTVFEANLWSVSYFRSIMRISMRCKESSGYACALRKLLSCHFALFTGATYQPSKKGEGVLTIARVSAFNRFS
jgi:hypothetical protein